MMQDRCNVVQWLGVFSLPFFSSDPHATLFFFARECHVHTLCRSYSIEGTLDQVGGMGWSIGARCANAV